MRGQLKLTKEDKAFSLAVRQRDNFKCVICGTSEFLNAHHIIPREITEYKFELLNGITLCRNHHFFCRQISAHNNPLALFLFLMENRPEQFNFVVAKQLDITKKYLNNEMLIQQ